MKETFEQFLDHSVDCGTIYLEASRCEDTEELVNLIDCCDDDYFHWLDGEGEENPPEYYYTEKLFNFIRHLWDAAYDHGRHDALAENGFTLAEID